MSAWEVYFLSKGEAICGISAVLFMLLAVLSAVLIVGYFNKDMCPFEIKKRHIVSSILAAFFFLFTAVFVPSKEEAEDILKRQDKATILSDEVQRRLDDMELRMFRIEATLKSMKGLAEKKE